MSTMPNHDGVPQWDLIDRLHKAMRVCGVTNATEMATLLGMHRNSVQDYLNGKREPDHRTLLAWAFACGVSADWLETGVSSPGQHPGGAPVNPAPSGRRRHARQNATDVEQHRLVLAA